MPPLGGDNELHEPKSTNGVSVVGVSTPYGVVSTRRIAIFVPSLLDLWVCRRILLFKDGTSSSPGGAGSTNPSQLAFGQRDWGFRGVQGALDPGDHRSHLRFDGVEDVIKDF